MVKQTNTLATTDESLVYTFPIVIDKSLQKEWGGLIRDFFTVQILSQIKSANILNITSSIVSPISLDNIDPNYRNPANELYSVLQGQNRQQNNDNLNQLYSTIAAANQRQLSMQNKSEIQYQIDSFREFIANQIQNDPIYDNLRPIATPIIIEGFMNIPLIVGTKEIKTDSQAIYWILFLCLADNLKLTSESTMSTIRNYIRRIPKDRFLELLNSPSNANLRVLIPEYRSSSSIDKINDLIDDSLTKNFNRLAPIFNERRWLEEVGIGREGMGNALQISASQLDLQSFQSDVMSRFSNLFIGFITRDIIKLIQSLVYVLVPAVSDSIDFTLKYNVLSDNFINISKYDRTQDIILGITSALYTGASGTSAVDPENSNDVSSKVESFCNSMSNISLREYLERIHLLRINMSNITYRELITFIDNLSTNVNNLIPITKLIKNFIKTISNNNVNDSSFDIIERDIFNAIKNFFQDDSYGASQVIFNPNGNQVPPIFGGVMGIGDVNRAKNFFATVYSTLTEFISFCYYYSFIGHICEYFKELKVRIDVKKKNALSFPNYVLVIPVEYITSLYNAMAFRRVSELLSNKEQGAPAASRFQDFKPNESEISSMINVLNQRLGIPHIVVIDSKKSTVYYKWNYLNRTFKMTSSSLSTYVKNQKNFIKIF